VKPHREAIAAIDARLQRIADRIAAESRAVPQQSDHGVLASGSIADGGSQSFHAALDGIKVEPGDLIRFSVSPQRSHGADSTRVELEIADVDRPQRWSLGADLIDDLLAGNPH